MTVWLAVLGAGVLNGCQTFTPDDEPGPNKTMAYYVRVESSTPGATIETNNVVAGQAPLTIKIFGDKDGNFHYFGNPEFVVRAVPPNTNEFVQTKVFRTGGPSSSGDRVPGVIFFDLGQRDGAVLIDSFPTR
jgi:hypothetical protein